ncbi:MarR family transcriptional regulator [Kibdelosporangium philippinense]|uniref:MarR family transcriptional regulator n=1 Tax=Kibdelosporangium philippinense TaxID=211113 RepID=A0ABS8ZR60_9PSEU|nr:MarR family transcriptional regulator [Kibdelosporangium philippinense]MCE7010214.1 MarR family transcriptional regulator [Kibdelosporangium philippinense]
MGVDAVIAQWRAERPDLDSSPIAVVGRVMRLSRFWDAEIKSFLAGHGLEPGEFDVLSTLRRIGQPHELTASAFMKTSLVTSGAITNRIDRMQAKGLVTRTRDEADRRSVRIRLTATGLAVIDGVLPLHLANEKRLIENLSGPDQRALVSLLSQLLDPFEESP